MGINITIHIYNYLDLVRDIKNEVGDKRENGILPEGRTLEYFVSEILPNFGYRAGADFISLCNELYEDYNAAYELFRAVELYFGVEDVFLSGYSTANGANAEEVLEELDINPIYIGENYE